MVEQRWESEFDRWVKPFLAEFGHKAQRRWGPVYLRGLISPGERKSILPIALRQCPEEKEQLHHFVATSQWATDGPERVLLEKADTLVGGHDAHLIIDDTGLVKKGSFSVGVAHQYCGQLGKNANCQTLVSLTLAREDVPVPIALRLYLPESWVKDPKRLRKCGVPDEVVFRPKWKIALDEIQRVVQSGVTFGDVLADAGYGSCAEFRRGLTAMGLRWAVGISCEQKFYPVNARTRMPRTARIGRPRKNGVPTHARRSAKEIVMQLGDDAWKRISWRNGTKGPLEADFLAMRVRVADGTRAREAIHLPGDEAWLVAERRDSGEIKYHLANHPEGTSLKVIASAIKARWSCEQAHQQLKEELGLDHFEGRSWTGLRHHVLLAMISFAFLQHLRIAENKSAA